MKRLLEGTANGDGTITYQGSPVFPEISDVQRLRLEPGDILVLTTSMHLSPTRIDQLRDHVRHAFGAHVPIVVLTDGMQLAVVNESELAR